jgi:histidinol-phosphatase (PHP family)
MYEQARQVAGGSDEKLFEDYFDAMLEMLDTLRPPVVAHFDLIRLFSDAPNQDLKSMEEVWSRIVKSLKVVVEQGALLEVNSSALRKGLKEPYPSRSVCEVITCLCSLVS